MQNVYFDNETNQISFVYERGRNVCIGETNETLQDFLDWIREDWINRNIDLSGLPTIERKNPA